MTYGRCRHCDDSGKVFSPAYGFNLKCVACMSDHNVRGKVGRDRLPPSAIVEFSFELFQAAYNYWKLENSGEFDSYAGFLRDAATSWVESEAGKQWINDNRDKL